jgi:peptide/nickel transport system permease protein
MKWGDIKRSWLDFWNEFKRVKFGVIGLILMVIFFLIVFIEPYIVPFPEASSRWRDITYWEDNPNAAPPVWINFFTSQKRAPSILIKEKTITEEQAGAMRILSADFIYDFQYDLPPKDLIFHCQMEGSPTIILSMERPDHSQIDLVKKLITSHNGRGIRISLDTNAKDKAYNFGTKYELSTDIPQVQREMVKTTDVLFAEAKEGILKDPQPLKGTYHLKVTVLLPNIKDKADNLYLSVLGGVSGLLGTDNSRRDIWSGIIAGAKWALLIGLLTAFVSISIGVIYGVMGAYLGGWGDSIMQRIFEIFVSIPLLPVLIVMSAIFKPNIWILISMMCLFFWVGPVKTVRSIGLQIKEETYIEAAQALGASSSRIIFKHMVPLLIPYAFASMALYVPMAVVYEATISLLGLGDATIVTWGQILHGASTGGAVINGLWWWVIPPGIAIALMGMTFAFIGFAMDTMLHPKLRTR